MLHYTVTLNDPKGHYFDMRLEAEIPVSTIEMGQKNPGFALSLPAWIPGSYLIREFARNILHVHGRINGVDAHCVKKNKDTWWFDLQQPQTSENNVSVLLDCKWRVYAWDLSVRGAHLDDTHGFFNGTSLFLIPHGMEKMPVELTISRPLKTGADWTVATGLQPVSGSKTDEHGCPVLPAGGFVQLQAEDYDSLIDHPVEMGALQTESFEACGVQHVFAVYGADPDLDLRRICVDLKPVCEAQIALFEPQAKQAPFDRYVFMLHATDNGYGGLEHRNSTALLCNASDLPQQGVQKAPKGYEGFLGLCSHEYFHAWNVKRMKPAAFTPYDLSRENYTSLLWIFEGFTSYYDDLMLARTGYMNEAAYLKAVGKTIAQVMKGPGRLNQSVADSSMDAWTKYYRQDENAPNSIVSYYAKGALVALCTDATIRRETRGQKSLDDVMRLMWKTRGLTGVGLGEEEFGELVHAATGVDLRDRLIEWTETTAELPLAESLLTYGFELTETIGDDAVFLGLHGQFKPEGLLVKQVINGGSAHEAGVSAGDLLVSIGQKKLVESSYKRLLAASKPGDCIRTIGFRAERLMEFNLIAAGARSNDWLISPLPKPGDDVLDAPWLKAKPT
jgi:predicted metalloprotease with PDZ domain